MSDEHIVRWINEEDEDRVHGHDVYLYECAKGNTVDSSVKHGGNTSYMKYRLKGGKRMVKKRGQIRMDDYLC